MVPASRDPDILTNMGQLAKCFNNLRRFEEAESQHWKILSLARKACGEHSHQALRAAVDLGSFFVSRIQHGYPERLLRNTLKACKLQYGGDFPLTYICMRILAKCETKTGHFRSAAAHFLEASEYYCRTGGGNSTEANKCVERMKEIRVARFNKRKERQRQRNPDIQSAGWSSEETLSLHAAAAAGLAHVPRVMEFDESARHTSVVMIPMPGNVTICSQCRQISVSALLKSRIIPGFAMDNPLEILNPMPGHIPLEFHFSSPAESSRTCRMCNLILGRMGDSKTPVTLTLFSVSPDGSTRIVSLISALKLSARRDRHRIDVYALKAPASSIFPQPFIQDPVPDQTLAKICHYLKVCDECHSTCFEGLPEPEVDTKPLLPTRSIYVPPDRSNPRLIVTRGLRGRYIALSHCWGGHAHFMCTTETLPELCKGIPLDKLSKTARDAIYVARKIGVEYLWIDSLCIVQNQKEDWLREAPNMGSIYEYSYVTLAATTAVNGNEGLFAPLRHGSIVKLPCEPAKPEMGDMYFVPEGIAFHEIVFGALNQRGWVLQEGLLSRRTIHFAATRVYWECQQTYRSEQNEVADSVSDSSNRGHRLRLALRQFKLARGEDEGSIEEEVLTDSKQELVDPSPDRAFGNDLKMQMAWRDIVTFYSSLGLTFTSDKLPALAGIVSKIQARSGIEHYDGHWFAGTVNSVISLLWTASGAQMTTPASPRAASWSWASLDGPVEFLVDEVDTGRLSQQPDDLQIVKVLAGVLEPEVPSESRILRPFNHTIQCLGAVLHVKRCRLGGHDSTVTAVHKGPYPRARYYHLGEACIGDHDWYPKPIPLDQQPGDGNDDMRFAMEVYAQQYPLRAQEKKLPSSLTGLSLNDEPTDEPDKAPGVGWVAFDRADEEPCEFYLIYVCTRQFLARRRVPAPQHLALACLPCGEAGEVRYFRRVGVAQVHQKGWFEGVKLAEVILV